MLKKRGALELQFNWIFVLIVGALIVALFVVVIQKQLDTSEYEIQVTLQTKLNTLMQNAKSSPGTTFVVPLKEELNTFDEEGGCSQGFFINENRNLRIDLDTAFSPNSIKSVRDEIILWVLPWEMPFEATNLVYITSPDVRYVLVGKEDGYAGNIFEDARDTSLPDDLNKEIVESPERIPQSVFDENNYKVKFVFFVEEQDGSCPDNVDVHNQLEGDITGVCIKPKEDGLDGWGEIKYYSFEGGKLVLSNSKTHYLGRPSVFGAIFAQDKEQFDCVMNNAYDRLEMLVDLYQRRTYSLELYYESYPSSPCHQSNVYYYAWNDLNGMKLSLKDRDSEMEKYLYSDAFSDTLSISNMNYRTSLKSCPTIY